MVTALRCRLVLSHSCARRIATQALRKIRSLQGARLTFLSNGEPHAAFHLKHAPPIPHRVL
jgi:hypothetical protein